LLKFLRTLDLMMCARITPSFGNIYMPNSKSAKKQLLQDAGRRQLNRHKKSRIATLEKNYQAALAAGELDQARALLSQTLSCYDKAAKTNLVHGNKVDRKKARLTRALSVAAQG